MPPAGEARAEAAGDGQACTPVFRLNVLLPDLPGFGVWRLESHGYHAAVELAGAAQLFDLAASRGQLLRVRLRVDRRHVKRPGQPRRDFVVPVVEIPQTLGEVLAAAGVPLPDRTPAAALDAPAPAGAALPAGDEDDELAPMPPLPPPSDDDPQEVSGRALLASRAQAAGVTAEALDALLRARYGAHDGLDDLDATIAAQLANTIEHPGLLARFVAAAAADLRAEHADAAGDPRRQRPFVPGPSAVITGLHAIVLARFVFADDQVLGQVPVELQPAAADAVAAIRDAATEAMRGAVLDQRFRSVSANGNTETRDGLDVAPSAQISSEEAATMLGMTPRRVRQLAAAGDLAGTKTAGRWLLNHDDIQACADRRRAA